MPLYLNPVLKKYYKYGTEPNVTVVGSPTIVDGIASGFSSSNYLNTPNTFNPSSNNWDMYIKLTTSDVSVKQYILGREYFFDLYIQDSKLTIDLGNGTSWSSYTVRQGTSLLTSNTVYYVKYSYDNGDYIIYLSTDGMNYNEEIKVSYQQQSSHIIPLGRIIANGTLPTFSGSIDLTKTYIKINGEEWWRGTKGIESTADDYDYIVTVPPKEMSRIYFGSTEISKIYNGSTLVYDNIFKQPVLTANGTLGGDSFAVTGKSVYSGAYWNAFDNNTSTIWHSSGGMPQWLTMYNPKALKLKKLTITTSNSSGHKGVTAGTVLGSNDNATWEHICDWTNDVTAQGATWEIVVNSQKYYKYHQLNITKTAYNPWLGACAVIAEIKMDAIK